MQVVLKENQIHEEHFNSSLALYYLIYYIIKENPRKITIVPMVQLMTPVHFIGFSVILYPFSFAWFCATWLPCVLLSTFFLLQTPRIMLKLTDFNFHLILLDNVSQILNLSLSSFISFSSHPLFAMDSLFFFFFFFLKPTAKFQVFYLFNQCRH